MPIEDFPFLSLAPDNYPRVWLPVRIVNPHTGKHIKTYGLVDTGADECAMPSFYAYTLGHKLEKGKKKSINTASGQTDVFSHTTTIEVFGKPVTKKAFTINDALIDYSPGLNIVLLGVRGFLDNFTLKIDYPKQLFSLKKKKGN